MITVTNPFISLTPATLTRLTTKPKTTETQEKKELKERQLEFYKNHLEKMIKRRADLFVEQEQALTQKDTEAPIGFYDQLGIFNSSIERSREKLGLPLNEVRLPKEVADRFSKELNENLPKRKAGLIDQYYDEVMVKKSKEAEKRIQKEIGQIKSLEDLYQLGLGIRPKSWSG